MAAALQSTGVYSILFFIISSLVYLYLFPIIFFPSPFQIFIVYFFYASTSLHVLGCAGR